MNYNNQNNSLYKMQGQSQLYFQSQEEITPIIDYIAVETEELGQSERWRLKDNLDISREKVTHLSYNNLQPSLLNIQSKNERVHTDSLTNQFDKKTTSIMQGYSINTIPSNEVSINTVKAKLRNYLTNHQIIPNNSISNLRFYSNQNSNNLMGTQRARANSIKQQSIHFIRERSKLLKTIDRSLQLSKQREAKQRSKMKQCKRQKKELLHEILDKLQNNIKYKKEVGLVRSNCKEAEAMQESRGFNKKGKKWVQAKNALKEALTTAQGNMFSTRNMDNPVIRNVVSQLKTIHLQEPFQSPKPITLIPEQLRKQSSVNNFPFPTKDQPSKRQDQIFTFNDIQNGNIHRHIKNVSIAISQNSSKQYIQQVAIADCVLCRVIGKRCSFH